MDYVVTLVANPKAAPLTKDIVQTLAQAMHAQKTEWLAEHIACDLCIAHDDQAALDAAMQQALGEKPYDAIVQPVAGRRKKLLISDMESTIIANECLDELAEFVGLKDRVAAITARAMNGELDFEAALRERVWLLKGLPASTLQQVLDEKVKLIDGAKELVTTMRKSGAYCMLVSGGFDFFTVPIKQKLGFDEERGNQLEIKEGRLTGNVISPILGKEAKLAALKKACAQLAISSADAIAVGDGANDLPMILEAGLGVAFHAKPRVQAQAKARVNHGNLTALLYAQGYKL